MSSGEPDRGELFDVVYLVFSGTTTAARCPDLSRGLIALGFATVLALPTPNASRVLAPRELADIAGVRVVESYFDLAIRPHRHVGSCCSRRAASIRSTNWRTASRTVWPYPSSPRRSAEAHR